MSAFSELFRPTVEFDDDAGVSALPVLMERAKRPSSNGPEVNLREAYDDYFDSAFAESAPARATLFARFFQVPTIK